MSILILACLLAICLPILSVQTPRFFPSFFPPLSAQSSNSAENGSKICERTSCVRRRGRPTGAPGVSGQGEGAGEGAEEVEEAGEVDDGKTNKDSTRRALDLPFLKRGVADWWEVRREKEIEIEMDREGVGEDKRKTGRRMEKAGIAVRLFPQDEVKEGEGEGEGEHAGTHVMDLNGEVTSTVHLIPPPLRLHHDPQSVSYYSINTTDLSTTPLSSPEEAQRSPWIVRILWSCITILAVLLCVTLFAVAVAYSLAAFLIYKTEARLGEARQGILQVGEMKLCLCAA